MARGTAISVKIATAKVIKALEDKLVEVKTNYTNQEANEAKYEQAKAKWADEVAQLAIGVLSKAENLQATTRYDGRLNVDFYLPKGTIDLPDEPRKDFAVMHEWQYREMVEEIENAIRILKMTDEEVVSTSTYNAVARYL